MTLPDPALHARIRAALAANPSRVFRIAHDGRAIWVKRVERMPLVRRLQKGDPRKALAAERAALHDLHRRGAPVPAILAEGADFLAIPDCGRSLAQLLADAVPADRLAAFAAAGQALAELHAIGVSHGRPSLKDILWDGTRIAFVDLERAGARRDTPHGHAMDVVMFVFNALVVGQGHTPELDTAIRAYRAADTGGIWAVAQAWCRRMRWIDPLTRPIQWRRAGKASEFKAIPLTLATFAAG